MAMQSYKPMDTQICGFYESFILSFQCMVDKRNIMLYYLAFYSASLDTLRSSASLELRV